MNNLLSLAIQASLGAGNVIMDVYSMPFEVYNKEDNSPVTQADLRASTLIHEMLKPSLLPFLSEEELCYDYRERAAFTHYWLVDPLDGTKEFVNRNGEFTVNIALISHNRPTLGVIYAPVSDMLWFNNNGRVYRLNKASEFHKKSLDIITTSSELITSRHKKRPYIVLVSRSHRTPEVDIYIQDHLLPSHPDLTITSRGSSLKFADLVEGNADIYVCYSKTKEWDTAAADALLSTAGGSTIDIATLQPLLYNKEDYHNPPFLAIAPQEKPDR